MWRGSTALCSNDKRGIVWSFTQTLVSSPQILARSNRCSPFSKSKGTLNPGSGWPRKMLNFHFVPRIASLAALATRNFTTFLALIWIVAPVAGLRPTRALRLTRTSLPRPGMVNESLAYFYASSAMCSRISTACFLVMVFFSAISAAICDLVSAFAINLKLLSDFCPPVPGQKGFSAWTPCVRRKPEPFQLLTTR